MIPEDTFNKPEINICREDLQILFEKIDNLVWEIDANYIISFANQSFYETIGFVKNELIKVKIVDFVQNDDFKLLKTACMNLENKRFANIELNLKHKTGFYLKLSTVIFRRDHNQNKYFTFLSKNSYEKAIDNKKNIASYKNQIEEQLFFHQTLLDNLPTPVFYKNTEGVYTGCNTAFEEMLGMKREDIIGKSVFDINQKKHQSRYHQMDKDLFEKHGTQTYESQVKRGNGQYQDVIFNKSTFTDRDGNIRGLIGIITNITERKKRERKLEDYKTIIENSKDIFTIVDRKYRYTLVNKAFHEYNKTTDEQVIGNHVIDVFGEDFYYELKPKIDACFEGQTISFEYLRKYKELGERYLQIEYLPIFQNNERVDRIVSIIRDVTEQRKLLNALKLAKEKAEESDRMKSTFINNMSHEIRTPLNAIIGFAELLKKTGFSAEKKLHFADVIHKSGNDLLTIVNDVLTISKIQASHIEVFNEDIDLNKFIEEQHAYYESIAHAELNKVSLRLNNKLKAENIKFYSDKFIIETVFRHLLSNSFKFTKSGFIKIGCKMQAQNLLFFVEDTGIGIRKEFRELVFESFRQADETLARKYGGTGLGLAISKGYLEAIGGKIWFESQCMAGTTFYFTIPFVNVSNQSQKHVQSDDNYQWGGKKILIIEDQTINIEYFVEILEPTNAELIIAKNGSEAINYFTKYSDNIDIVLLDINLPDISGFELIKKFISIEPDIKIIAQTAYCNDEDKQNCYDLGCIDYISKPIRETLLLQKIDTYLC